MSRLTDSMPSVPSAPHRLWIWFAGAVVIAAQLAAVGLVVDRQVERAAERQAEQQEQARVNLAVWMAQR